MTDAYQTAPRPRAACSACSKRTALPPPVEHDRGVRQRLALQPATARHLPSLSTIAGVSAVTPAIEERLFERLETRSLGIACESQSGTGGPEGVDHAPAITSK